MNRAIIDYTTEIERRTGRFENKKILDLACGEGAYVRHIAEWYPSCTVFGIDIIPNYEKKGSNWEVFCGSSDNMPFEDNTFDTVYSLASFEHIRDIENTIKEVRRVLKPFGRFWCSFSCLWTSVAGYHYTNSDAHRLMLPPWGHLYMSRQELSEYMKKNGADENEISGHLDYMERGLNHHSRSHIANAVINSGMLVKEYKEAPAFSRKMLLADAAKRERTSEMTQSIKDNIIERTEYRIEDLGVYFMSFLLEKYKDL